MHRASKLKSPVRRLGLIGLIGFFAVSGFLIVNTQESLAAGGGTGPLPGASITAAKSIPFGEAAAAALESFWDRVAWPGLKIITDQAVIALGEFAINKLAYDTAVALVSAGKGETPLMFSEPDRYFQNMGLDVVGEGIGLLSEDLKIIDINFNLCAPAAPPILLALQIGIKQGYKPGQPKCEWRDISKNWSGFVDSFALLAGEGDPAKVAARRREMLNSVAQGLRPGNNELGAAFDIKTSISNKEAIFREHGNAKILANEGYKDAVDPVTGEIKTNAAMIKKRFEYTLIDTPSTFSMHNYNSILNESDTYVKIAKMAGGTFLNTLLAQTTDYFFTGILPGLIGQSPFDLLDQVELARPGGRENAREQLAGIFAPSPFTGVSNYSVLSEFTSCPTGNYIKRNLNNCVMDSGFFQAVSGQEKNDVLMTVQEALDRDFLHGAWPLVSSQDNAGADNQDVNCYQSAYCFGNLVKMRKARIISSGWEIAAEKSSGANRATLQEVVDGFSNCNSQGVSDATHPWCHLIDPNWVLKYPQTQCNAFVNGEIIASSIGGSRSNYCADAPSCVEEDNNGNCTGGYGYCTREENTWRFPGTECPDRYASCYAFENTFSGERKSLLFNTVETGVCNAGNAGCMWYAQEKSAGAGGARAFDEAGERIYLNNDAGACSGEAAGCTQIYDASQGLRFNLVQNASFYEGTADKPDDWQWSDSTSNSSYNTTDRNVKIGNRTLSQRNILLSPNTFYTFGVDAKGIGSAQTNIQLSFNKVAASASDVSLAGTSFGGNCTSVVAGARRTGYQISQTPPTDAPRRYTCTFTTNVPLYVDITLDVSMGDNQVIFDNVQLETGERATGFFEKYAGTQRPQYYKLPPAELGCRGLPTDHADCKLYAGMCAEQDVGCTLYTPEDGDQPVPAVASPLDICPDECVGYTSFKQLPTDYDTAPDQLDYFIADQALSCSAQDVGCDSFTNLDTVAAGGEGIETYTDLRACLTEELAKVSPSSTRAATYYTWEGSDNAGYQLKTWRLLKTNAEGSDAPCTNWEVRDPGGEFTLTCTDTSVTSPAECDEHQDIFDHPELDCREFYDTEGNITYQLFSKTVTVSDECHPYRKTISDQDSCEDTGGLWISAGECRYFGLPSESLSCPAASAGCREYIGGAGRNQVTVLYDNFEDSAVADQYDNTDATIRQSNESLAAGGHSLSVQFSSGDGFIQTKEGALADFIDPTVPKTYFLEFWAKGSGTLGAKLVNRTEQPDEIFNDGTNLVFPTITSLSGDWKKFTLGPVNTTVTALEDNTVLRISGSAPGQVFYLDNLSLRQTVDTVTVIKNSWVVDAACDETPEGIPSPQYYLGCAAYTSSETGKRETYHQFNRLCSEQKVGCKPFFDTQNSESEYSQVFQARCHVSATNHNATATEVTSCELNGETVCTIAVGRSYCIFDLNQDILDPTSTTTTADDHIVLGSEFVRVSNDAPVFLVDNGVGQCGREQMGCEEMGRPVYNQDKSRVNSFESKTLFNLPDKYDQTLCEEEALFCEEWASTLDGNFYFKDPADKSCEWKTGVTIAGRQTNGWFRTGTNEPCYWTDTDGDSEAANDTDNGRYDYGVDPAYLVDGERFEIWRNGDVGPEMFDGWAGACESRYDLCTEFVDASDGREYHFINDDSLRLQDAVASGQRCSGDVSQKFGCAALNNAGDSTKMMATSPSYLASRHADVLFGDPPFSLQTPIDCSDPQRGIIPPSADGGIITTTAGVDVNLCLNRCRYGFPDLDPPRAGNNIVELDSGYFGEACLDNTDCPLVLTKSGDAITGRCVAVLATEEARFVNDANTVLKVTRDRECAEWLACSSARASFNPQSGEYESICDRVGLCTKADAEDPTRCAEWADSRPERLTETTYVSRDVSWSGKEYSGYAIPEQYPVDLYEQKNLNPQTVCGNEAANPRTYARDANGELVACDSARGSTCITNMGGNTSCISAPADFRLAVVAGPCTSTLENAGAECKVGSCRETGVACAVDDDCLETPAVGTNTCVTNYCAKTGTPPGTTVCSSDSECVAAFGLAFICNGFCQNRRIIPDSACTSDNVCVSTYGTGYVCSDTGNCVFDHVCIGDAAGVCPAVTGPTTTAGLSKSCIPSAQTKVGACYNYQCLQDLNGVALENSNAEAESCRGYPEPTSPYAATNDKGVVSDRGGWEPELGTAVITQPSQTFQMRPGFDAANVCAPVLDVYTNTWIATDDCLCSYKKVQYGEGVVNRYYSQTTSTASASVLKKICSSGAQKGWACTNDEECRANGSGQCVSIDRTDTLYGWSGYCLERDTSIQLNGRSEPDLRPCLTWLPVDQLAGSTDLFGKYTEAGYNEGETYYCADIDVAYDLRTTSLRCAEQGANCPDNMGSDWDCWKSVQCPEGYFGVVTGCGDASFELTTGGDHACTESLGEDDDCPFYCVPKLSYRENADGEKELCKNPVEANRPTARLQQTAAQIKVSSWDPRVRSSKGFYLYSLEGVEFKTAYDEYYRACTSSGVEETVDAYLVPNVGKTISTRQINTVSGVGGAVGYYPYSGESTDMGVDEYAFCSTLVQVSNTTSGLTNAAWTDRVWSERNPLFTLQDANPNLRYSLNTPQSAFGRSTTVTVLNSGVEPLTARTVMCGSDVAPLDSTNCFFPIPEDGKDARPYLDIEISYPESTNWVEEFSWCGAGTSSDRCDGSSSNPADLGCLTNQDCNIGIVCGGAEGAKTCSDGPNIGDACVSDHECQVVQCRHPTRATRFRNNRYYCAVNNGGTNETSIITTENADDALTRLRQIFATTLALFGYRDSRKSEALGGTSIGDLVPETESMSIKVPGEAGYALINSSSSWIQDFTGSGDGSVEKPSAPMVVPVEECRGTDCFEPQPFGGRVEQGFTVNGLKEGEQFGDDGFKHVSVSFYTYANKNQMPIRNIIIDWGNTRDLGVGGVPDRSFSGSPSADNFYKNHRGIDRQTDKLICDDGTEWGKTPESCSKSYVSFENNYTCTEAYLADLQGRRCSFGSDGFITNSPCVNTDNKCVFRPRVHVRDNWGWCTGICRNGPSDGVGNSGCYDGEGDVISGVYGIDECNWQACPDNDADCQGSDPWVYYDGQIIVAP